MAEVMGIRCVCSFLRLHIYCSYSAVLQCSSLGLLPDRSALPLQLDSHEKSLNKGRSEVTQLVDRLRIAPRDDTVEAASRLYKLALSRNFTRGRRTQLVIASLCLSSTAASPDIIIACSSCQVQGALPDMPLRTCCCNGAFPGTGIQRSV